MTSRQKLNSVLGIALIVAAFIAYGGPMAGIPTPFHYWLAAMVATGILAGYFAFRGEKQKDHGE
jgi:hypothetical protein